MEQASGQNAREIDAPPNNELARLVSSNVRRKFARHLMDGQARSLLNHGSSRAPGLGPKGARIGMADRDVQLCGPTARTDS